jgi:hypothetical protein
VTIALEALDSRYFLPQPGLDRAWLDGAIGDVLIRLDAMLPRFTATFPPPAPAMAAMKALKESTGPRDSGPACCGLPGRSPATKNIGR